MGAGRLAGYQDDYAQAHRFATESLQQATLADDQPGVAAALSGLAFLAGWLCLVRGASIRLPA